MKRCLLCLLSAAACVLAAAVWVWFFPVMLVMLADGSWDRNRAELKRIERIRERFAFDRWLRKQNKRRRKHVWKNRNTFYK